MQAYLLFKKWKTDKQKRIKRFSQGSECLNPKKFRKLEFRKFIDLSSKTFAIEPEVCVFLDSNAVVGVADVVQRHSAYAIRIIQFISCGQLKLFKPTY